MANNNNNKNVRNSLNYSRALISSDMRQYNCIVKDRDLPLNCIRNTNCDFKYILNHNLQMYCITKCNMNYKTFTDILERKIEEYTPDGYSTSLKMYKDELRVIEVDHITILHNIIIESLKLQGIVPVSTVISDFIYHCKSDKIDVNLKLTEYESLDVLKRNLSIIENNFPIKTVRQGSKRLLVFTINSDKMSNISFHLPMITSPCDWSISKDSKNLEKGGYLHNYKNIRQVRKVKRELFNDDIKIHDSYKVLINMLQGRGYSICSFEESYKEHIVKLSELRNSLKLLNRENSNDIEINDVINLIYEKEILVNAYKQILTISKKFNYKNLYLIPRIDFRGRLYMSGIISPTSDKILRKYISYNTNKGNVIEMDATASILQILATITYSKNLSTITNLNNENECRINTWNELLSTLILNKTVGEIRHILDVNVILGITNDDILKSQTLITRNVLKYTIMRMLYGSNPYQIASDYRNEFHLKQLKTVHIKLIFELFKYEFTIECNVLKVLRMLNKGSIKMNNKGLLIDNKYTSFTSTYYKVNKSTLRFKDNKGKLREVEWYLVIDEIDTRKSNIAFPANYFHSLDSLICLNIIMSFLNKDKFILTIHDAFLISKDDEDLLLKEYNYNLFSIRDQLINLIEDNICKIKLNKQEMKDVEDLLCLLKCRRENYFNKMKNCIYSKTSLKKENTSNSTSLVSRRYMSTTTDTNNNNNEILTFEMSLPNTEIDIKYLLNYIRLQVNNNVKHFPPESKVRFYYNSRNKLWGNKQKVSTRSYSIYEISNCLSEFIGKLKNYGDQEEYIPMLMNVKFSFINEESIKILKRIKVNLLNKFKGKPKNMPNSLFMTLMNIKEQRANIDDQYQDISRKLYKKIRGDVVDYNLGDKICLDKDGNEILVHSKNRNKFNKIQDDLKALEDKGIFTKEDKYWKNRHRSGLRFYYRKYNLSEDIKRLYHTSTNVHNYKNVIENEVNNINVEFKRKYYTLPKRERRYLMRKFITPLTKNMLQSQGEQRFISADFESVVYNNKHFPFCVSYTIQSKKSKILDKISLYINTDKLNSMLINIEFLSNNLLIKFWLRLKFSIVCNIFF